MKGWLIWPCGNFLTLGADGKTLKFRFFVIRVYYEKLGHMLKPLVPKFHPDLLVYLKIYRRKTDTRKAETDSRYTI